MTVLLPLAMLLDKVGVIPLRALKVSAGPNFAVPAGGIASETVPSKAVTSAAWSTGSGR